MHLSTIQLWKSLQILLSEGKHSMNAHSDEVVVL